MSNLSITELPDPSNSFYPDGIYETIHPDLIFCFGSNDKGIHGKGAALTAVKRYGAQYGVGEGLSGKSYAIPTKYQTFDKILMVRSLKDIEVSVKRFVEFTQQNNVYCMVTAIGTGLAMYDSCDIAPMFKGAVRCWFPESWKPWLIDDKDAYPEGVINGFFGEYRQFSNFYNVDVNFQGFRFPSVENAYQASKAVNPDEYGYFTSCSSSVAKKQGKKLKLREGWDEVKMLAMKFFLKQKFTQEPFRSLLLGTGNKMLVEYNQWHDYYWGVCNGKGENRLGKLLMQLRSEIKHGLS